MENIDYFVKGVDIYEGYKLSIRERLRQDELINHQNVCGCLNLLSLFMKECDEIIRNNRVNSKIIEVNHLSKK